MSRRTRPLPALLALVLAACDSSGTDAATRGFAFRRVRVLVGDAESGRLSLFDAEDGAFTHRFEPGAPAPLHASFTGQHAVVALPTGARLLASGVSIWEHIDHVHVYKDPPRLLRTLSGDAAAPVLAVASNDRHLLLGHPGSTDYERFTLVAESHPEAPATRERADIPAPLPAGLLSVQRRPAAARLHPWGTAAAPAAWPEERADSRVLDLAGCLEVRTLITAGTRTLVACAEGFLSFDATTFVGTFAAEPRARRTRTLYLHPARPVGFAQLEDGSLLRVDGTRAATMAVPDGLCDLALDPGDGTSLIGLTRGGEVLALDPMGAVRARVPGIVRPFDCAAPTRPRLGAAPRQAYVTDPDGATLIDVDLGARRVVARVPVGGRPSALAVLGLDPRNAGWRGPRPGES